MRIRLPKVYHKIIKTLDKNLFLCTDTRATELPAFEGSKAGGGYKYFGYKNPTVKIDKHTRQLLRKAIGINVQTDSKRPTRTNNYK